MQLKQAVDSAHQLFIENDVPSPRLNAELLLMFALNCERSYLYAHPERDLTADEQSRFDEVIREYLAVLETPRGGRTLAFIFCNGAFHGGIFAWLAVFLISRYHLHDTGIGLGLAGYGLPGIFIGALIGKWGDRYGRSIVVPAGFLWAALCAFLLVPPTSRFIAALVITALSVGFDATHPLMSSITTSIDPKHRGQITGLATFTNFAGMGIGAVCFQQLIAFGFGTALAAFASAQALLGFAALYDFRGERPGCTELIKMARARFVSS